MKTLILAFLLASPPAVDMMQVRELFAFASIDENKNELLLSMTEKYTLNSNPVLYAYHGGALTTMANHSFWPSTKLDYFNKGKEKIELAVKTYPKNVEIRYVRYSVQQGCPFFLDYYDDMDKDRTFILSNMDRTNWSGEFKKEVKSFLNK